MKKVKTSNRPWDNPQWNWNDMTPKLWELFEHDQIKEMKEIKKTCEEELIRCDFLIYGRAFPEFTLGDGSRGVVEIRTSQQNKYPELRDLWRQIEAENPHLFSKK